MTDYELDCYCWSSWMGMKGNDKVYEYFHLSLLECGMKRINNTEGFGYSGATWATIFRALKEYGIEFPKGGWWNWCEKHPFELNEALASYYLNHKMNPRRWHNRTPEENGDYMWNIFLIKFYCENGKKWKPRNKGGSHVI